MMRGPRPIRRGLALAELIIGMAITALIGLAVATTLVSVGQGLTYSREARSALQRAYTAHTRVRAYFDPGLCVLEEQGKTGFALWLHDGRANGAVNLSELRVFWYDFDEGVLTVEWVEFPEDWDAELIALTDVELLDGADYFQEMLTQRALGRTSTARLVDGLADVRLEYDAVSVEDAQRLRFTMSVTLNEEEAHDVLLALALPNHRTPT
ncbi:MAG: hypothetical protein KDA21_01865 [Phycisphaerales bacterium]|nr:hypothetical protein [Phycisphaerales bacterium]